MTDHSEIEGNPKLLNSSVCLAKTHLWLKRTLQLPLEYVNITLCYNQVHVYPQGQSTGCSTCLQFCCCLNTLFYQLYLTLLYLTKPLSSPLSLRACCPYLADRQIDTVTQTHREVSNSHREKAFILVQYHYSFTTVMLYPIMHMIMFLKLQAHDFLTQQFP